MEVSVAEAKNKLTELIKAAESGEKITICRRGVPVADIVRTSRPHRKKRVLGTLKGRIRVIDRDWWKPMSDEEVDLLPRRAPLVRLLLDTAALIYAVEAPERLSKRVAGMLRNPQHILEISSISLAEIAIKANLGKLRISAADAQQAVHDLDARVLAYTGEHALSLFGLPSHHRDPFDRQIIAQALAEKIPVVTPDETFALYQGLNVIW